MSGTQVARVVDAFSRRWGRPDLVVRGPGRVNLIGEHTDYNLGLVLPAAVDRSIWLAVSRRADDLCRFHSVDLDQGFEIRLGSLARSEVHWANYLLGILVELGEAGHRLSGVDCAFGGDLPIGSGMSSSAALECGFAFALDRLLGLGIDRVELARIGQRSENRFVGVRCGIMDQFASLLGEEGRLVRLDCRDLSFSLVPFERGDLRIALCDTQVRRALAGSEYNVRRAQCEEGVAILARRSPEISSLRDATRELLEERRAEIDPLVFRRCAYVVDENLRVEAACAALTAGDLRRFGALMCESHAGLRDEYQVSCPELDALADAASEIPGVLGSRMMGAGFGGCTINLVEDSSLPAFVEGMSRAFRDRLGLPPVIHVCRPTCGTEVVHA